MIRIVGKTVNKLKTKIVGYGIRSNVNNTSFSKNCLLKYIVEPFDHQDNLNFHQNQWQVKELARVIGEFKYNVDVINFNDGKVKLTNKYDLVIDLHPGLNSVHSNYMNDNCIKVGYITGSNPEFSNKAEAARIEDLYKRKGVRVKQRRYVPPFDKSEFESLDAVFFIGNSYNLKTYSNFNLKKVFLIKNTGYSFLNNLDFSQKSPNNFLFFASWGQVHKGLDLLLDIFSENKNINLYVCSRFKAEKDFSKVYKKELFYSKNIFPVGFVDIGSINFKEIIKKCSYVIMPSCSEGIAGSVLTAMSAGLIPIVSKECGFEDDEVIHFENCSMECIAKTLDDFSRKSIEWISQESIKTLEIVRTRYSEENFTNSVRQALKGLLSG